jgi:hypothetical protein
MPLESDFVLRSSSFKFIEISGPEHFFGGSKPFGNSWYPWQSNRTVSGRSQRGSPNTEVASWPQLIASVRQLYPLNLRTPYFRRILIGFCSIRARTSIGNHSSGAEMIRYGIVIWGHSKAATLHEKDRSNHGVFTPRGTGWGTAGTDVQVVMKYLTVSVSDRTYSMDQKPLLSSDSSTGGNLYTLRN